MGTAVARLTGLRERTHGSDGWLRGSVTFDQAYAQYQHEALDLRHPRGGGPKYLERPLFEHYRRYYTIIARSFLEGGPQRAMQFCMEDLSDAAERAAPWELRDLNNSGHPEVHHGVELVYDRPPRRHRLTPAELAAKTRLRWPALPGEIKGFIARRGMPG